MSSFKSEIILFVLEKPTMTISIFQNLCKLKSIISHKLNRVKRGTKRAVRNQGEINKIIYTELFFGYVSYTYDGVTISTPINYERIDYKIYLHDSNGNRMLQSLLLLEVMSITIIHLDDLVVDP